MNQHVEACICVYMWAGKIVVEKMFHSKLNSNCQSGKPVMEALLQRRKLDSIRSCLNR